MEITWNSLKYAIKAIQILAEIETILIINLLELKFDNKYDNFEYIKQHLLKNLANNNKHL